MAAIIHNWTNDVGVGQRDSGALSDLAEMADCGSVSHRLGETTGPALPLGNGGLASTIDDWYAFARMLLGQGSLNGRRVLSAESVLAMTRNQLTPGQRLGSDLFLEGQGWGYGGAVDIVPTNPWNIPGRYGWTGGTGTSAHVIPSTNSVTILLTQVGDTSPHRPPWQLHFWRYACSRIPDPPSVR